MFLYILRRLPQTILVIFGVTLVTFIALQIGGDPTYLFISDRASPEEIEATRIKLGFDKPLYVQYINYLIKENDLFSFRNFFAMSPQNNPKKCILVFFYLLNDRYL